MFQNVVEVTKLSEENLLLRAKASLQTGNTEQAMEQCTEYLNAAPDDVAGLRLYANLHGIKGDLTEAIKTIGKVISLNRNEEPCDYFYRGRWRLRAGQLDAAIRDFENVIAISQERNDAYYVEDAYLHQAIAFFYQENKEKAYFALSHVSDDCRTSANGVVFSKSYIVQRIK